MSSGPHTDTAAQTTTTEPAPQRPGNVIVLLLQLAFVAFCSVMAGYWLLKPFVNFDTWFESSYVKSCKALVAQSDAVKSFRVDFKALENGETYKIGEPGRTTGYYTILRMTYGQARETVNCHADVGKTFTKAEITIPGIGCIRHFPTGQREIRPSC